MISLAQKLARLADIFGGGNNGYGTPLSNRNYIVDPNFDQIFINTVVLAAGQTTIGLATMYRLSAGAAGTATTFAAAPGLAANDQPGMYSPMGGSVSISPNGDCTGTIAGRTLPCILQDVEFAQTLSGRSSTFSCWLWSGSGTVTIPNLVAAQVFGTGGSPSATVAIDTPVNWVVTTTPQRFSVRIDWPSIQGKTLGTNKNDYIQIGFFLPASNTINVGTRQWQLEQSSPNAPAAGLPTAFEYRGAQAEQARVLRYYEAGTVVLVSAGNGPQMNFAVPKRAAPTLSASFAGGSGGTIGIMGLNGFWQTALNTVQVSAAWIADSRI